MIDYKALHERCRREGKSTLDLDDLAAGHPVAEAELAEYARLRMAVDDALTSFHLAIESFDTPEQALDALLDQQGALAAHLAAPPAPAAVPENVLESLWRHTQGVDPETGKAWLTPRMMAGAERLKALLEAQPAPPEPGDDPQGLRQCTHPECGRFFDHNAQRQSCRAIADGACAAPRFAEPESEE